MLQTPPAAVPLQLGHPAAPALALVGQLRAPPVGAGDLHRGTPAKPVEEGVPQTHPASRLVRSPQSVFSLSLTFLSADTMLQVDSSIPSNVQGQDYDKYCVKLPPGCGVGQQRSINVPSPDTSLKRCQDCKI